MPRFSNRRETRCTIEGEIRAAGERQNSCTQGRKWPMGRRTEVVVALIALGGVILSALVALGTSYLTASMTIKAQQEQNPRAVQAGKKARDLQQLANGTHHARHRLLRGLDRESEGPDRRAGGY